MNKIYLWPEELKQQLNERFRDGVLTGAALVAFAGFVLAGIVSLFW